MTDSKDEMGQSGTPSVFERIFEEDIALPFAYIVIPDKRVKLIFDTNAINYRGFTGLSSDTTTGLDFQKKRENQTRNHEAQ